jgi:hypothetical protein
MGNRHRIPPRQVARAVAEGIPVAGYLYWLLPDNYEWADGVRARFGLLGVDYATQARTVRPSARRERQLFRRELVPKINELQQLYRGHHRPHRTVDLSPSFVRAAIRSAPWTTR